MTPKHARPLRAIVYVRLSSHRGAADPSTSPARQRESCSAYAVAKGWELVEVVEDLDVSGSDKGLRLDRPGLRRVRDLLPDVDVVIFAKLDRLARNVVDFRAFADEAEAHGAALVSVAESLDLTTPSGRFVATILAAFAEMEAATIAERTVAGKRAAVQLRRWANGSPPYGYRTVPHPSGAGRALEPDPVESAFVRAAVDHVLRGGSLYSATKLLNASGSKPRRAAKWAVSSLRVVLTSPALSGQVRHLRDVLRGPNGLPEVVWEPLVSPSEAAQLRALLAQQTIDEPRRNHGARILSGLVKCSSCDSRMRVNSSNGIRRYSCGGAAEGRDCAAPVSIRADFLDAHLERELLDLVGDVPVTATSLVDTEPALELADVEEGIRETASALVSPEADVPVLVERLGLLRARREELAHAAPGPTLVTISTGESYAEAWASRDVAGKRDLVVNVLEEVRILPGVRGRKGFDEDRVEIRWAS